MAVAFAGLCHAQDVLVKKDGSTILAKVLRITETEVEYKDFNNQDGPTRVISISNLQAINYQNGQKETFSEQTANPAQKPDIVTNETATKFSNDQQLMQMYNLRKQLPTEKMQKKVKRLRRGGWIAGSVLVVGGIAAISCLHVGCDTYCSDHYGHDFKLGVGIPSLALGAVTVVVCCSKAKKIENMSRFSVQSASLYQQEINIRKANDHLMVGLDMLQDNSMKNQTLGMGLRYNF